MRRGLLSVFLAFAAMAASAGTRFDFVVESTGDPLVPRRMGTISIQGSSYRVDYEEGGFDSSALLSADAGLTETALNSGLRTYFTPKALLAHRPDSRLLLLPPLPYVGQPAVTLKQATLREEPDTREIDGRTTRKYVLKLVYEVGAVVSGEKLRALFSAVAELWTTEQLEATVVPLDPRSVRTGYETVDLSVRNAFTAVKGFPLERRLSVTRRIIGGEPQTDLVTTTFRNFAPVRPAPDLFQVPAGYRYQKPVLGVATGGN